jgi:hypothetical protein
MARQTVADRAELHPTGVRRVLDSLAEAGVVEIIGSGRNQAVHLRIEHPLARPLRQLFHEEREGYDRVAAAVRNAVAAMSRQVDAIWLEHSTGRLAGVVHLGVLASPEVVDGVTRELEERLAPLSENLAVHFVGHGYTAVDVDMLGDEQAERLSSVTLLHGWIPIRWRREGGGPIRSHRELDERARRLAAAVAERLPSDPGIIRRALAWLDQRLETAGGRETPALRQWRNTLANLSVAQIQKILTEDSERARELRQSLPFAEVLTAAERRTLFNPSVPND